MSVYQRLIDSRDLQVQFQERDSQQQHLQAQYAASKCADLDANTAFSQAILASSPDLRATPNASRTNSQATSTHKSQARIKVASLVKTPATKHHFEQLAGNNRSPQSDSSLRKMQRLTMNSHAQRDESKRLAFFSNDDPVLLRWLQNMRLETELECLAPLQAKSLARDEHSARALSVRNSQVAIQALRQESELMLDFIDHLIECLPLSGKSLGAFCVEFESFRARLADGVSQSASSLNFASAAVAISDAITQTATNAGSQQNSSTPLANTGNANNLLLTPRKNLVIIDSTPRKKLAAASTSNNHTLRLINELVARLYHFLSQTHKHLVECSRDIARLDSTKLEAMLRKLMETYGRFVELSIRTECANIVRALDFDFAEHKRKSLTSLTSLTSLASVASVNSLQLVRPFETNASQLSLKWALIALWQLTKDDPYICRALTEKWLRTSSVDPVTDAATKLTDMEAGHKYAPAPSCKRRLDYSDENNPHTNPQLQRCGALSSALSKSRQRETQCESVTTVELLINILINQPNQHERVDVMNYLTHSANNCLIDVDVDKLDRTMCAAIYTSNQFKVATLRILNHLCVEDSAVRTILRCFWTKPPQFQDSITGRPIKVSENKIIRSIFELSSIRCSASRQSPPRSEHVYENEHMLSQARHQSRDPFSTSPKSLFRNDYSDSDYDSQQNTSSAHTKRHSDLDCLSAKPGSAASQDDVVIKEAIRLIVQITTPFHRSNRGHDYYSLVGRYSIESLVKHLTRILSRHETTSRDVLFLSLSALANISFITTEPMKTYGTNRAMLELFRKSREFQLDLDLRDQAVTLLANTAERNVLDIISNGGLTFLLSCLESCPTKMASFKACKKSVLSDHNSAANCNAMYTAFGGSSLSSQSTTSSSQLSNNSDSTSDPMYQKIGVCNKARDRKPLLACQLTDELCDIECDCDHASASLNIKAAVPSCADKMSQAELSCMERIRQKTAVAFARMSSDANTTRMILKYGGVKQMIDLCKFSSKRSHSDTVLIACIAALRKMAKVIERETFRYYNALDLIELELNQALEIYGATTSTTQANLPGKQQHSKCSEV